MALWRARGAGAENPGIDEWYRGDAGQQLFAELEARINPILATSFGYYALQIGCPGMAEGLLAHCRVKHRFTLGEPADASMVQGNPSMLPIASDSVDLVILMHHLSNTDEPHAVLREAFRILIPEGRLVVIDFNPISLWGLRHLAQGWLERTPFRGHFYTARRIDDWMRLLGFDQDRHMRVGYQPPIQKMSITRRLGWVEKCLRRCLPALGALNLLVYSKNVSPLTPIRHRWVTRKLLPGRIARPGITRGISRGMKYDR